MSLVLSPFEDVRGSSCSREGAATLGKEKCILAVLHLLFPKHHTRCTVSSLHHTLFARFQASTALSLHGIKPSRHSFCTVSSLHVAAQSLASLFVKSLCSVMNLSMSIVLLFLAIILQASGQSAIATQPYCHAVSTPFSNNPDYWLHGTPVVRSHWWFDFAPLVRRQYADYWFGWDNVSYLFAL